MIIINKHFISPNFNLHLIYKALIVCTKLKCNSCNDSFTCFEHIFEISMAYILIMYLLSHTCSIAFGGQQVTTIILQDLQGRETLRSQ